MDLKQIERDIRNHMLLLGDPWVEEILTKGYWWLGGDIKIQASSNSMIPKGQLYLMNLKEGALKYGLSLEYDFSVIFGTGPQTEEKMIEKAFTTKPE